MLPGAITSGLILQLNLHGLATILRVLLHVHLVLLWVEHARVVVVDIVVVDDVGDVLSSLISLGRHVKLGWHLRRLNHISGHWLRR